MTDPRRGLPSVPKLLALPALAPLLQRLPHQVVLGAIRGTLEAVRAGRIAPPDDWAAAVADLAARQIRPSLQPVINATGVVLHTNLGRAPLAPAALQAVTEVAAGYSNLEYDLPSGARGSRTDHCASRLAQLCGAESATVLNNAAAALVLALNEVAAGREVILSRGELVEIGGSFRIPDIIGRSGAVLREVGTTNRTHLSDYASAISDRTGAILTVHRSNFEQRGYVASPDLAALAELARRHGIPCVNDVGSGLLVDLADHGLTGEPSVPAAVRAGADLVIFSGDKLLGGPQAGCLAGREALVDRCRRNPLARAMRPDKMTLAALAATLSLYSDSATACREVPVLRMLTATPESLTVRAAALAARLAMVPGLATPPVLVEGHSAPGGGSFPGSQLLTTLVALDPGPPGADGLALRLRLADPPVVARVQADRVVLDPRTIADGEFDQVAAALAQAVAD